MVGAEDGAVAREVVEAVHDDGDDNVQHDERAEENEADKVEVGHVGSALLVGVHHVAGRLVVLVGLEVADAARDAGHHDVGPCFSGGASGKKNKE